MPNEVYPSDIYREPENIELQLQYLRQQLGRWSDRFVVRDDTTANSPGTMFEVRYLPALDSGIELRIITCFPYSLYHIPSYLEHYAREVIQRVEDTMRQRYQERMEGDLSKRKEAFSDMLWKNNPELRPRSFCSNCGFIDPCKQS